MNVIFRWMVVFFLIGIVAIEMGAGSMIPNAIAAVEPGVEFLVNTYRTSNQDGPSSAMAPDGRFVVAWQSDGQDGNNFGIYAQRYDASGNPQGAEFRVSIFTEWDQLYPSVAMASDGRFVVVWQSNGQDGIGYGIYAQRYNASGNTQGAEFRANTYTLNGPFFPCVAMSSGGWFVVGWDTYGQDGNESGVFAQRYDASGNPQGAEFRVNTHTTSSQDVPNIAMEPDESFVVVWTSYDQDGSGGGVYAQRYDASGNALGSEFRINTHTVSDQYDPHVASAPDGRFVVVWSDSTQDGYGDGVYGQRYNASGNAQGMELRVNTYTTSDQFGSSVAIDPAGRFVVVWMSDGQDGSNFGVYAQRYDAEGNPQGAEFRVNTYTTGDQSAPHIAMDSNSRFVVTWMSDGQDGDGYGVYAKLFNCIQDYDCPSDECNDGVCMPLSTTTTTTHPTTTTSTQPTTTTTTSSTATTHTGGTTTSTAPSTSTTTTMGGEDDDSVDDDLDDSDDEVADDASSDDNDDAGGIVDDTATFSIKSGGVPSGGGCCG